VLLTQGEQLPQWSFEDGSTQMLVQQMPLVTPMAVQGVPSEAVAQVVTDGGLHTPPWHVGIDIGHTFPQVPQLSGSIVVSTHMLLLWYM